MKDALLQSVLHNPADDGVRLAYADALEEAGELERAELIRVQIALARDFGLPSAGVPVVTGDREADMREAVLRHRVRQLRPVYFAEAMALAKQMSFDIREWWVEPGPWEGVGGAGGNKLIYKRGFLAEVRCRLETWRELGPRLVACQPVERVVPFDKLPLRELSDENGYSHIWDVYPEAITLHIHDWHILPPLFFWRLTGGRLDGDRRARVYPSPDEAYDDLSAACLGYARWPAGLPA